MSAQSDLFEQAAAPETSLPPGCFDELLREPIAVPCGFMDRTNSRCRRLAMRPVMVDGEQFVSRGRPMLHCDPACYSVAGLEWQASIEADRP